MAALLGGSIKEACPGEVILGYSRLHYTTLHYTTMDEGREEQ